MKEIKESHKIVCELVLCEGMTRTDAYMQVYPRCQSRGSAKGLAYRMFKRPEVHEYYTQRRQELFDELEIDAITIAKQLSKIALAPEDDENTSNTHRIAAMNLLQKQLGLQTQRVESKVEGTITINVDVVDDGN